jgi:hypothetical protein
MKKILTPRSLKFANFNPEAFITKEATADDRIREDAQALLMTTLADVTTKMDQTKQQNVEQFRNLTAEFAGVKAENEAMKADVLAKSVAYAETTAMIVSLQANYDQLKRELDAPIMRGGKDLADSDRSAAVELQRRIHLHAGGTPEEFKEDLNNLVVAKDYRSATNKLVRLGGIESRAQVVARFDTAERKAFDNASMDSAFFMPEMLGIELDCNVVCAEMLDLYSTVSVGRSNFMYPEIKSYGDIGTYGCDASCDAELGPEGNIGFRNGNTSDFRGVFCFQKKVLQEANYDLLGFMIRAAARSHRINRNKALIVGDGINQPQGWLAKDCFAKLQTASLKFDHVDFRRFLSSAPVEYGEVTAVMHQNMFAYLASKTDAIGRFVFGDGQMTFSPDDTKSRIRISNCLPDATNNNTRGDATTPFVAGDFIAAAGNWKMAYYSVEKRPMFMEQYIGGSSAWCVKYQFGAEDGGFVACCPAARTLNVGP